MVTLNIKMHEQELLRKQVFDNIQATLSEVGMGYSQYLSARDKIHTVKELALIVYSLRQKINGVLLQHLCQLVSEDALVKYSHLATAESVECGLDDEEYANYVFNRGLSIINKVTKGMETLYPRQMLEGSGEFLTPLVETMRGLFDITDRMQSIPGYKFTFIDTCSEEYIYLRHVVCSTSVRLKLTTDFSYGELTCSRDCREKMEKMLENYVAMSEVSESIRLGRAEEEVASSFF